MTRLQCFYLPVKMTTGDVQELKVCLNVKVVRCFTGRVVTPSLHFLNKMVYKDGVSNVMDKAFALQAMQPGGQRTPMPLSESKVRIRADRPIKLSCFADLRPDKDNENIPSVPLVRQQIPICSFNEVITIPDGESIESILTHPDEDIVYHEYCDEVMEGLEQVSDDSNKSNSQSDSDSVADLLVDPVSFEEIRQLVPVEGAESFQPLVRDPEYTSASDLKAVLRVSKTTQIQKGSDSTSDSTVVELEPLSKRFTNVPLSVEAKEYLAKQPLQQFPRTQSIVTKSIVEEAGLDLDRLLSPYSSVDSNGNARVKTGFVAVKHLHLTENSPEVAALRQELPLDSKINVVVAIQRGRGGVGKVVRVSLGGTVCQECNVKKIQTLFKNRFEIDGQKHQIAPFVKHHLTLTAVGLPYDLRSNGTNGPDQTFVMLLPRGLHDLHRAWWQGRVPIYNFRDFYQTVKDFYSVTREHDCNLWLKHEDKLAAYGLTPQDIIEATKHGHQLDNMMMDLKIKSEWSQREETNKTKQVPAFVLNKRIIYAATQTSGSYNHQLRFPVVDEIATREMYESFTDEQKAAVKVRYNRKMKEASLVKRKGLSLLIKYYERLYKLAHHLEVFSRLPEARQEGVTKTQIHEHITTKNFVINTFSALIDTILTDVSFKEAKEGLIKTMQTWKNPTVTQTLLSESMSSRNELLDTVAATAESLSLHFSHKTITKNLTVHRDARASQALLKECVLKVNEIAQKETKEKEKKAYYFGGGRTL